TDALNKGVPTDRLIALWSTAEQPGPRLTIDAAALERLPRAIEAVRRGGALDLIVADIATLAGQTTGLLEIPDAISRLRSESPDLAEGWRRAAASAFASVFAAGFEAVDFVRIASADGARGYYVLYRDASWQ